VADLQIPETIAGVPTGVAVLGVGGVIGLFIVLRSRGQAAPSQGLATSPVFAVPMGGGGGGGGGGGETPRQPETVGVTQASLLDAWAKAQTELANLTVDPQKKLNRLGASWTGILQYLNQNPAVFGASPTETQTTILQQFLNVPASLYGWIVNVSNAYEQAKDYLVEQTQQGYFRYMTLPDLVRFLRLNPLLGAGQAWRDLLVNLPLETNVPASTPTATTAGTAATATPVPQSQPTPSVSVGSVPSVLVPAQVGSPYVPTGVGSKPTPLTTAQGLRVTAQELVIGR